MIKGWLKNIGPGPLIAAAFIGPGTVTVCTLAGSGFGFSLLWAIMLSVIATIVLQEMSARLGIVTRKGLSEIIRTELKDKVLKFFIILLMLSAIVIGNAAYEAGNLTGGVLGLETIIGNPSFKLGAFSVSTLSIIIGFIAFLLLYLGNYKVLENVLIFLVTLMSLAFLITAIITKPDFFGIIQGAFVPELPKGSLLTVIALVGTTVVPYNLFLHAALVKEKWKSKDDLYFARKDIVIAVILGGLVSMCIVVSADSIQNQNIKDVSDLAKGLEPLFGDVSKYILAIGLFAAGITSAITAPLAAAFVASGCLGWSSNMKSKKFRAVWIIILVSGVLFSSLGIEPIDIIKFAQVANGILLPVIAGLLIWIMNKKSVLGAYKNSVKQNIFSLLILGISILLSLAAVNKVFELNIF